jgi:hypothetical protein
MRTLRFWRSTNGIENGRPERTKYRHIVIAEIALRNELPDIIENLVRDTPRTAVAATKLKKMFKPALPFISEGFKAILAEVITESAERMIWP